MACHSRGDIGGSVMSEGPMPSKMNSSSDSISEWRSREQLEASPPSTSPVYWDTDEEDDFNSSSMTGPKPTDLYGKFTWKIENFSEISKRELRSNVFEVGGYKWYILVYPQGCDVCNHLSLFLCVADYDKLLPGWSHFAQFTIAVVNKDQKKSKYSDTLHRFCKKEHDWGWKKFMELSKILDGFTVANTLVIKAQVQVIRENPHCPFRCLDSQYRRELVRVYLTNVEGICRRFVEEKREKLGKLVEDTARWTSFQAFWSAVDDGTRWQLAHEKTDVILKAIVKRFFNEKEVTSTLVMDALYSGCKALAYRSHNKKGKADGVDMEETISLVVWVDKDAFVLAGDVLLLLERVVSETLPPYKDDKGPQSRTKDISAADDIGKDSVERDEQRLTELGRRTVEMFVLAHLYTNRVEVAYREAVALKRQEELIREEEAAGQAETELRAKREAAEREKRSRKKQAKQRRKDRKEKDKEPEEKCSQLEQESFQQQSAVLRPKERLQKESEILLLNPADTGKEEHDLSGMDTVVDVVGTLGLAMEDGDNDHTGWERGAGSYGQSGMEVAGFSGAVLEEGLAQNGKDELKHQASALDDSSSTCSSDSLPSVRPSLNDSFDSQLSMTDQNHTSSRGRSRADNEVYETVGNFMETEGIAQLTGMDLSGPVKASSSCSLAGVDTQTVILSLKERVHWLEQRLFEKEEEVVLLQERLSLFQHQMVVDGPLLHQRSLEKVSDASGLGLLGSTGSVHADESRSEVSTSSLLSDGAETPDGEKVTRSSKEMPTMNGHSVTSNGHSVTSNGHLSPVGELFPSRVGSNGDNTRSSFGVNTAKLDVVGDRHAPGRSHKNEPSSPSHMGIPSFPAGISSVLLIPAGVEDTSSTSPAVGPARPTIVLGLGEKPAIPFPVSHCVGATGHVGNGVEANGGSHSNESVTPSSPPVDALYRNAATGKLKGSLGVTTYPVTLAPGVMGGILAPIPGVQRSASYMGSSNGHSVPNQVSTPATSSISTLVSSPPLAPSTTAASTSSPISSSKTEYIGHSLASQDECSGQESAGGRCSPVGITFGTVTPEMLQHQQQQEQEQLQKKQIQESLLKSKQQPPVHQIFSHEQDELEQARQHLMYPRVEHMIVSQHHHQQPHERLLHENTGLGGVMHAPNLVTLRESMNNGTVMSEEFPHLDIINDLLEDDQGFGMAFSAMLQHPGASQGLNHHLSILGRHTGLHTLNHYGQRRADGMGAVSSLEVDGTNRAADVDLSYLHSMEGNCNSDSLADSRQMTTPFSHQPLVKLHNSQHGFPDGVLSHYWPVTNVGMQAGSNNVRNGLGVHMGYPLMQTHHTSVSDRPSFSPGHNRYSVYAPVQQP